MMNSVTKTFEDFPVVFLNHEDVSYISHKSLAEYFKWNDRKRRRRFETVSTDHPQWVAYFNTSDRTVGQKMSDQFVGTDEFEKLDRSNNVLRCLTRHGLMMTLMQETKHPRAIEFQDFAISALDSLLTHGHVRLHQANSLAEQTAKINAENERLKLQHETLRLQIQHKRLCIEERKTENASLIRQNEAQRKEISQLLNLKAHRLINKRKGIRQPSPSQFRSVCKFVKLLGDRFIVWKSETPYFKSRELYEEALPHIDRLRLYVPQYEMTTEWKMKNNICPF